MSPEAGVRHEYGRSILLVQCEDIPEDLMDHLRNTLVSYLDHVFSTEIVRPGVLVTLSSDPVINSEQSYEWFEAFNNLIDTIPSGIITLVITGKGLWDTSPFPRFIFASGFKNNTVVVSTRRFASPNKKKRYNRLSKEIIKAFGMTLNMRVCLNNRCIMSYHYQTEDLDMNIGVCPVCQQMLKERLTQVMGKYDADK